MTDKWRQEEEDRRADRWRRDEDERRARGERIAVQIESGDPADLIEALRDIAKAAMRDGVYEMAHRTIRTIAEIRGWIGGADCARCKAQAKASAARARAVAAAEEPLLWPEQVSAAERSAAEK